MIKINNIEIRWNHQRNVPAPITVCEVKIDEDRYLGTSKCSLNDNFCKDCGRKISLSRALDKTTLSKEKRFKIWEEYRTATKIPRWQRTEISQKNLNREISVGI